MPARAQSTDADLSDLVPSAGALSPEFATETTAYTMVLGSATTSITVTPTLVDPAASVKVNGVAVTAGNASAAIPLRAGSNAITAVVTAKDGVTKKTYTIQATVLSLTVTTVTNGGAGSLRQALANAALVPGADDITFAPALSGKVITLDTELTIADADGVALDSAGLAAGLAISGNDSVRIFNVQPGSTLSLTGLTLRSGVSGTSDGGAINNAGDLTITRCTLSGNGAMDGGAIYNTGTLVMARCTLAANTAAGSGGALWSSGQATLTHCTISKNRSDGAGGITFYSGTMGMDRCIVSGNTLMDGVTASDLSGNPSQNVCLISDDALLAPLGSYGGATQTMALLAGSPARDAAVSSSSTADQRGFAILGVADMGAYESQLGGIADTSVVQNGSTGPLALAVGNAGTLKASSSNTALVPNNRIVLGGSGANRTVTVNPAAGKFGAATITITDSTRGDSTSFELEVRAFGAFVFSNTGYSAVEGTPATIEVTRIQGTGGTVTVNVATAASSVSSATADTDYTALTQTLTFLDGEDSKTIQIDTASDTDVENGESFQVKLSIPAGSSAVLGDPAECTVTIIDPSIDDPVDNGQPTLIINTPIANTVVGAITGGIVRVSGSTRDTKGVAKVEARIIAPSVGSFVTAGLGTPGSTSTQFAALITPPTGPVTVEIVATDFAGNTRSATRAFIVGRQLVVNRIGNGFATATSFREVGKTTTVTASPAPGNSFAGWIVNNVTGTGITPAMLPSRSLTFTFVEGLVLTAQFVPSPFNAMLTGTYTGLVMPSATEPAPGGSAVSTASVGSISCVVTTNGMFTGRLGMDGATLMMMGTLDTRGVARFGPTGVPFITLKRPGKPDLEVALQLDMSGISGEINGTVTRKLAGVVQAVSNLTAYRAHFGPTNKIPAEIAGTATQRYNLILPARASQPGLTSAQFPQGTGVGSMIVTPVGMVTLMATLADGTACVATTRMSRSYSSPFFVPCYTAKGCFATAITLDPAQPGTDVQGLNSLWIKPARPTDPGYRAGWPAGILVDVIGAKYVTPTGLVSPIPGLGPVNPAAGNATLTFDQGRLPTPISFGVNITPTASLPIMAALGTTTTLNRVTGEVTGIFIPSPGKRTSYRATTLQKAGANRGTFGFFTSNPTVPADGLAESGTVVLRAK